MGFTNTAAAQYSTVSGGRSNDVDGAYGTIAGGGENSPGNAATANRVTDDYGTIGGGANNQAGDGTTSTTNAQYATAGGGSRHTASGPDSTIGGGYFNTASGETTTIGGGSNNSATASAATVGGGLGNPASSSWSTVPGGANNEASGDYSFVAGRRAIANANGAFVWGDSTDADIISPDVNSFTVRAAGGTDFFSNSAASVGVHLAAGGNAWAVISDRNVKANFAAVDGQDVLAQLASVPIETWNLKSQDKSIRHIGPMAQDFYAAFAVGEDDTHITTSDADGVALAAIQALYDIVLEQDSRIAALTGEGVEPAGAASDPASAELAPAGTEGPNGLVYGLLLALLFALPAAAVAAVLGRRALAKARA